MTKKENQTVSMELMHELLKQIHAGQTRMEETLVKHDKRFAMLERQLAGLRGDFATVHELIVDHRDDLDGLKRRVERIERRLELSDA